MSSILDAARLFEQAIDLDERGRAEFLDTACRADAELRDQVEALLNSDDACPGGFLRGALGTENSDVLSPGTMVAGYRIDCLLGSGGMGVVYGAEQASPRRRIALKVIRPGSMSAASLRRFSNEAYVLGQLQHPGIAQVFEAGTARVSGSRGTEVELPFLAMELIRGRSLLDHARHECLDRRARLILFTQVCEAVSHAHQRGIIHRDLKPDNVLVSTLESADQHFGSKAGGEQPVAQPKILDFGIARVLDGDRTSAREDTLPGQVVGTLATMSPEQAATDERLLDVRSDVYALGVLLYMLLVESPPIDVSACSLAEALRRIAEVEPDPLSKRDPTLKGDLTVVATRALEKEPDRRYQSAMELAEDIRRHLSGAPILARGDSAFYLLSRRLRRNRQMVVAALLLTAISIAFAIVASLQAVRNGELAEAEAGARLRADETLAGALEAVDALTEVAQVELRDIPRAEEVRRHLLEAALVFQRGLTAVHENGVGKGEEVELATRATLARLRVGELLVELGATDDAIAALTLAIDELVPRPGEGREVVRARIDAKLQLGRVFVHRGDLARAAEVIEPAVRTARELYRADEEPWMGGRLATGLKFLAQVENSRGRLAESESTLLEAASILEAALERDPENGKLRWKLAGVTMQLGKTVQQLKRSVEAGVHYGRSLDLAEMVYAADPENRVFLSHRIGIQSNLSVLLSEEARVHEAIAILREAIVTGRELVANYPQTAEYRELLTNLLINLSGKLMQIGDPSGAIEANDEARDNFDHILAADPTSSHNIYRRALLDGNSGSILIVFDHLDEAEARLHVSREGLAEALEHEPNEPAYLRSLSTLNLNMGLIFAKREMGREAARCMRLVLGTADPVGVRLGVIVLDSSVSGVELDDTIPPEDKDAQIEIYVADALAFLERCSAAGWRDLGLWRDKSELDVLPYIPSFSEGLDRIEASW